MSDEDWIVFAKGQIVCPRCGEPIPVPVEAKLSFDDGQQRLETRPDMTELWSHTWAHGPEAE